MSKDSRHRVPGWPGSSFTRALAAAGLMLALGQSAAIAAPWRLDGAPVDSSATGQTNLRAVTDGRAGLIAAWIDTLTGVPAIRCQRVDSTGAVRWTTGGVLVRANARGVSGLAVAPDGRNGILLAWVDSAAAGQARLRVQRVKADSAAQWTAGGIVVDTTSADTLQGTPAIDSDGAGGAIVAWVDGRAVADNNDNDKIYVQRFDSTGVRLWTAAGVRTRYDGGDDDNTSPRVLGDGSGGAWVSWQDPAPSARVFIQLFDAAGAPQWITAADPLDPSVSTPNGSSDLFMSRVPGSSSLMLAWFETGGGGSIRGAILTVAGSLGSPGTLLGTWNFPPRALVGRSTNAFYLVSASGTEVRGITINSAGAATGSSLTIATESLLDASSNVSAVSDAVGGVNVTWAAAGVARARHIVPAGTSDWGPTALTTGVTPAQTYPVPVPGADLLVAWIDGRNTATGPDLYAQRVSPSGVTGTYYRIFATVASGNGAFSAGGGRTWVRQGDVLSVRFTGTGGHHVDSTLVGGIFLRAVPNYTFHDVKADSTLQAWFSNAAVGTQLVAPANFYRAFSVPATLSPATISSLFASWMPYDPVRWRLGHYEANDSTYLDPQTTPALTSIVPGAGYWFIGLKDTTLAFSGTFVPETQYSLPLHRSPGGKGWNQFGSPFRFPLAVSQLRLSSGPNVPISDPANVLTDPQVLEWNPGSETYGAVSVLYPGRAYWLWRQGATAFSLLFPFEWNPVATGGLEPQLATLGDWAVGVTARASEREASLVFGAAPVAAGRWNRLSTHALPDGPGDALKLVARVSDWGADNGDYASVFRPDAGSLAWEFDASAASGLTESALSFAFTNLPADRRVVLSEPATGWSREVAADESVPLVLSAGPRRLRLEVLAGAPVTPSTPLATALRAAGPNPFRESATLSFSLARGGPLRWDVFDLAGRRVVSGARTLDAGEHVVTWDGRDAGGRRVEPGLYLLRWQADGRSGTARLVHTD